MSAFVPSQAPRATRLPTASSFVRAVPLLRRHPFRFAAPPARSAVLASASSTPQPSQPLPNDASALPAPAVPSRAFTYVRLAIFVSMSLTYAAYVFLRSTFTYVAPAMAASLSLSLTAIGKISSAFPLAYGSSRLITGVLVDRFAPHRALCLGLFLAASTNAAMAATTAVPALAFLWALNGLVQGAGAGASAKMLTAWFSPAQRGIYWALWSSSANIGAFLAPVVCASLADSAGFRAGLAVPGLAVAAWALLMLPLLRSTPADAGHVVPWASTPPPPSPSSSSSSPKPADASAAPAAPAAEARSWRRVLVEDVLKNPVIWRLAFAYFFVYIVRYGTKAWLHFWLVEARGVAATEAAARVSGMEVGGIVGTFSAGLLSDACGGRRVAVTVAYLVGMVGALAVTLATPASGAVLGVGVGVLQFAAFAAVGFMINGPQMMIGLIGAEACDRRVVASATGVLGWISYLGAAASGFPLSLVIRRGGWPMYFGALMASCVAAVACLMPMWGLRASQKDS